ncbi:hypothetical protein BX666DRAFT_2025987 [Dichotomocladium elegans]|nr:hypothetical protein BX666DRAFT_2025987 [Dichotomocladium elegans]
MKSLLLLFFFCILSSIHAQTDPQWIVRDDFEIDVHRFAHLVSSHLLFDHLDTTYAHISRKVSLRFREWIGVSSANDTRCSPVDVHILKGQITGAVGSFIEDKLPTVWNDHAPALDRVSLESFIEQTALSLCPPTVSSKCLAQNAHQLLANLDHHVGTQLRQTLNNIVRQDLPHLFQTTQHQVESILSHFNQQGCRLHVAPFPYAAWSVNDLVSDTVFGHHVENSVYEYAIQAKMSSSFIHPLK